MPEIVGRFLPDGETAGACVWCQRPAAEVATAPGLGGREVSLHPTCGAAIIYAYNRWRTGRPFRSVTQGERATRLFGPQPRQITAGDQDAHPVP